MICPNGIAISDIETSSRKDKINNTVPHLLFLSNLIESKGVFVLLDALKILEDRGVSFVCIMVGGETKEIDVHRLAEEIDKRQLNKVVLYKGRKYGEEKNEEFQKSDIFVFPSSFALPFILY